MQLLLLLQPLLHRILMSLLHLRLHFLALKEQHVALVDKGGDEL